MKKLGIILLAALMLPVTAFSQDDAFFFNHLGVGVTAGLDGFGGEVGVTVNRNIQIRLGYSFSQLSTKNVPSYLQQPYGQYVAPYLSFPTESLPDDIKESFKIPDGSSLDLGGRTGTSQFKLLVDLYPSKTSLFHFTVGAFTGDSHLIDVWTEPLPCDPAEYNNAYIVLGGERVGTDKNGQIKADVRMAGMDYIWEGLKPYVGIGFGRAVPRGRVSLGLDLGALYNPAGFKVYTYNLDGEDVEITTDVVIRDIAGWDDAEVAKHQDIIDQVNKYKSFGWFPMTRLRLNVRIF
ncbi:MAG: hypothetical protein J6X89_08560 [Bacteroidales bacterium]|nr:hypothetical protein [Bacteroidales bacterium]